MHISGGEFSYVRRCKTGDYEHKELAAKISFSLDVGEDYDDAVNRVGVLAITRVHQMLGLKDTSIVIPAKALSELPKSVSKPVEVAVEEPAPVRAKPSRTPRVPVAPVKAEPEPNVPINDDVMVVEDETDEFGETVQPDHPPITDADLIAAIKSRAASGIPPSKIKDLTRTYMATEADKAAPKSGRIAQHQRQEFLSKLAELKA